MMKNSLSSVPTRCRSAAAMRWFSTRPSRWLGALSGLVLLALWLTPGRVSGQIGFTGAGALIDRRQPSLALNYLICVEGIYPNPYGELSRADAQNISEIRRYAGGMIPGGWLPCDGRRLPISGFPVLYLVLGTTYGGDGVNDFALPDLRGRTPVGVSADLPLGTYVSAPEFALAEAQMPAHSHGTPTGPTSVTGSSAAIDNRQPGLALHHLILTDGLYSEIGEIVLFAGLTPPLLNTLPCDGRLLSVSQYAWLNNRIGDRFGGDGVSQFAIPDLRGRAAMGAGQGPGLTARTLGATVGADFVTLTTNQLPAHTHSNGSDTTESAGLGAAWTNVQSSVVLNYMIYTSDASYPSTGGTTSDPFLADVRLFACPAGTTGQESGLMPADGTWLRMSQYSATFSLLGGYYGWDNFNLFGLPDTRGRVIVGALTPQATGTTNGAESRVLTVAQLPVHTHEASPLTRLEYWRQTYFGSITNAGNAANGATPFGDGVPNLVKFATGLPGDAPAAPPGVLAVVNGNLEFTYPRSEAAMAEVTLMVEWSDTLAPGSWTSADFNEVILSTHAGVQTVKATIPMSPAGRRFLRLGVMP